MDIIEGLLLGLSTGATCLISCGPILLLFLFGERKGIPDSFEFVGLFLSGRLAAYMLIGAIVGYAGKMLSIDNNKIWLGVVFCALSILIIAYGFHQFRQICLGSTRRKAVGFVGKFFPQLATPALGFLTAINVCPPLLLAISGASAANGVLNSITLFMMFFIGTAIYFIPLPLVALLRNNNAFQIIGKYAAIVTGIIFLVKGITIITDNIQ